MTLSANKYVVIKMCPLLIFAYTPLLITNYTNKSVDLLTVKSMTDSALWNVLHIQIHFCECYL